MSKTNNFEISYYGIFQGLCSFPAEYFHAFMTVTVFVSECRTPLSIFCKACYSYDVFFQVLLVLENLYFSFFYERYVCWVKCPWLELFSSFSISCSISFHSLLACKISARKHKYKFAINPT